MKKFLEDLKDKKLRSFAFVFIGLVLTMIISMFGDSSRQHDDPVTLRTIINEILDVEL